MSNGIDRLDDRLEKVERDIEELTASLKVVTSVLGEHIRGTLKAQT